MTDCMRVVLSSNQQSAEILVLTNGIKDSPRWVFLSRTRHQLFTSTYGPKFRQLGFSIHWGKVVDLTSYFGCLEV